MTAITNAGPFLSLLSPAWVNQQRQGWPWWAWLLLIIAVILVLLLLWWWLGRSRKKENAPAQAAPPAVQAPPPPPAVPVAVAPAPPPQVEPVAPPPPPPAPAPAAPVKPDDLKVIEGIGPKISGILQAAGITTFAQLAGADVGRLKQILQAAGLQHLADPGSWPEQARLAAEGKWDELQTLQDSLKGGRRAE